MDKDSYIEWSVKNTKNPAPGGTWAGWTRDPEEADYNLRTARRTVPDGDWDIYQRRVTMTAAEKVMT